MYPHLLVTGLPRSGTTLLYRLLACCPRYRAPAFWEIYGGNGTGGERRARARLVLDRWRRDFPWLFEFHPIDNIDSPEDCNPWFGGGSSGLIGRASSRLSPDRDQAILLKSPDFEFPWREARVIVVCRDYTDALESATRFFLAGAPGEDPGIIEGYMEKRMRYVTSNLGCAWETVSYEDLVADPVETIASAIPDLDEFSLSVMGKWCAEHHEPWMRKRKKCKQPSCSSQRSRRYPNLPELITGILRPG